MNTGSFTDDSANYSDFWLMNSTMVLPIFSSTGCYWWRVMSHAQCTHLQTQHLPAWFYLLL